MASRTGRLVERYEYTPYGQRTVYSHGWLSADVDDDGDVDDDDRDIMAGNYRLSPATLDEGDVNGSGHVSQTDVIAIFLLMGESVAFDDDPLVMYPAFESYRHDENPYGLCDFGHQGLMHDKEFGLVNNRARYLHPQLGRFISRDPGPGRHSSRVGTRGYKNQYADGMNRYQYVKSNPTNRRDPMGLQTTKPAVDRSKVCCKYSNRLRFDIDHGWFLGQESHVSTYRYQKTEKNKGKLDSPEKACKCSKTTTQRRGRTSLTQRIKLDKASWGDCCWAELVHVRNNGGGTMAHSYVYAKSDNGQGFRAGFAYTSINAIGWSSGEDIDYVPLSPANYDANIYGIVGKSKNFPDGKQDTDLVIQEKITIDCEALDKVIQFIKNDINDMPDYNFAHDCRWWAKRVMNYARKVGYHHERKFSL